MIAHDYLRTKRSHGSVVSILSRASQHKLGKEVLERGWETLVELNKDPYYFCHFWGCDKTLIFHLND